MATLGLFDLGNSGTLLANRFLILGHVIAARSGASGDVFGWKVPGFVPEHSCSSMSWDLYWLRILRPVRHELVQCPC